MPEPLDDVGKLILRTEALEKLLVCFRISKPPSEKLFAQLDKTKAWTDEIVRRRAAGES